ncbi:phosphotransferase [Bacillus sp. FSL K6-3431]|uniref:phosphotransferase n=1 Tax=Bacillus sp. FSL K6-3431 TaxID=2921500 RepID=UPI0030FC6231
MWNIDRCIWNINHSNLLPFRIVEWKELNGGTSSSVWKLLGDDSHHYVLKSNEYEMIKAESDFLLTYQNVGILPKVLYVDNDHEYFIYTYISGNVRSVMSNKKVLLKRLVNKLITQYKPTAKHNWGWTQSLSKDWHYYLLGEIESAKEIIGTALTEDDFKLVKNLIQKETRINPNEGSYLLHGDCGVHNFLQVDNRLVAVIDPMPLAGPLIYELVFAFCSSPEQLTMDVIYEAAKELPNFKNDKDQLVEEVIIGLYIRMLRCIYHHPQDLPVYLEAWKYWTTLNRIY